MHRLFGISSIKKEPLISICWVIGLVAIVGGALIVNPWVVTTPLGGASAIAKTVASPLAIFLLGTLAIASGISIIYGIVKNKMTLLRYSLFFNMTIRIYTWIIAIIVFGFAAPWLSGLTMILIILILYIALEKYR